MSDYNEIVELCDRLKSLAQNPKSTNVKWNDEVRTIIKRIAIYDTMCIFSNIESIYGEIKRETEKIIKDKIRKILE